MSALSIFDVAGRRRSPATTSEFHLGCAPGNKGLSYPADPPRGEEIVAVMRQAGGGVHGDRARGLIVVLWRAGLRIGAAPDLHEMDLEPRPRGFVGPGGQGRPPRGGTDDWGWEQLRPWLARRVEMPVGPLFCVIDGPARGRPWAAPAVRIQLRQPACHLDLPPRNRQRRDHRRGPRPQATDDARQRRAQSLTTARRGSQRTLAIGRAGRAMRTPGER